MIKKMNRYSLIFLLSFLLISCLDRSIDNRNLKIYNMSSDTIFFFISENDAFTNPYQEYSEETIFSEDMVKQDTFAYYTDNPISWEDFIMNCKDGKMRLFIVAKDSVDKYGIKEVISQSVFTQKYLIDIDYLNRTSWFITYKGK